MVHEVIRDGPRLLEIDARRDEPGAPRGIPVAYYPTKNCTHDGEKKAENRTENVNGSIADVNDLKGMLKNLAVGAAGGCIVVHRQVHVLGGVPDGPCASFRKSDN